MIWEELNPTLVFTDVDVSSSDDVMHQIGGALIREGYAKNSYIQALIERESKFPTGLDVDGYGVAIPHTNGSYSFVRKMALMLPSVRFVFLKSRPIFRQI